ncbi:hypothetical protein Ahy_B02g058986 [Arachis hypogaea]|uniref:non-specific serine/threonine protein kinase n=1 Tax=Arachis hypogaea TaxID=3818 RepID=A0A445AFS8_ARAHY|nr:hypothetical protein Ahy_B02g058986 [Arachis hypogaea]
MRLRLKEDIVSNALLPRSTSLNAFDIILFSKGFDLSGLFEEKGDEARFVTSAPVGKIISKLEEIAHLVRFSVRKKDCRVSLEGRREGLTGLLTIAVEIFELMSKLVVVEVKKKGGNKAEYERFCNNELRPDLMNLMKEEGEGRGLQWEGKGRGECALGSCDREGGGGGCVG